MQNLISRETSITSHIVRFCRFLRKNDFQVGTSEEMDCLHTMKYYIPPHSQDFKALLAAVFVKNQKEHLRFQNLFDQYWSELNQAENSKIKTVTTGTSQSSRSQNKQNPIGLLELKNWLNSGRTDEKIDSAYYSTMENLNRKDFSNFSKTDQKELIEVFRKISHKLANDSSRRYRKSAKSINLNLKETIRHALSKGVSLDSFLYREKKIRKLKILLLCDVSKSMDLYSRFLIQFLYGFNQTEATIESFVFSTTLSHVSPLFKQKDFEQVLESLGDSVYHWSGGTRIGHCFQSFIQDYSSKYLNSKTIVIILSDGWDTGEPDILEKSVKTLKRKCRKIIWLNPLAGHPDYRPTTAGMAIVLPYLDLFAPAHNLASLIELRRNLGKRASKDLSFKAALYSHLAY